MEKKVIVIKKRSSVGEIQAKNTGLSFSCDLHEFQRNNAAIKDPTHTSPDSLHSFCRYGPPEPPEPSVPSSPHLGLQPSHIRAEFFKVRAINKVH